jgi:MFS family permease
VAIAGTVTVAVGAGLSTVVGEDSSVYLFAGLLATAAILWTIAATMVGRVREPSGETASDSNALGDMLQRLAVLRKDSQFQRFILVRALFVSTALAAPYYVIIARESGSGSSLGVFVVASGLASALSSVFWGRFADRSSRRVLIASGAFASALGFVFFAVASSSPLSPYLGYLAPAAFFALAIAHSGVRIGRKTYVVDLATAETRIDYVAVGNTLIGLVVLASGLFGLLEPVVGAKGLLLIFSLLGSIGVLLGMWLPEAE